MPAWIRPEAGAALLSIHVQPGAKSTRLAGLYGDALKIRLAAPPVEGRANAALIEFVAGLLHLPRRDVELVSGAAARSKRLRVALNAARVAELLAAASED
ncbi:MAG: DUF167 domain-containing protein [Rhodocyclaceae bacterium]|nr:DUF167 domain-containing protein [Rhodocyclaceae bacterium]